MLEDEFEIRRCGLKVLWGLDKYHYCEKRIKFFLRIFGVFKRGWEGGDKDEAAIAVICYVNTLPGIKERIAVFGDRFEGLHNRDRVKDLNENMARIARVIVHPEYQGIGIGTWLVKNTMGKVLRRYIECITRVSHDSSFLVRAGMTAYQTRPEKVYYLFDKGDGNEPSP